MSAKRRMRDKKMRNQPASVQYPSSPQNEPCSSQNKDTPQNGDTPRHGIGQDRYGPSTARQRGSQHQGGWVRGHQRDGGGYAEEMPKTITAKTFARARAAEVTTMLKAVTKPTGSCNVFMALPKHMRRRAMSHNTKRLPCRLREMANRLREKHVGQKKVQAKNKSRKARRRHGNLLLEFNRRQRKNVWLETHIWHAKRFHMLKQWGYCLGDRPTYKCYRACYRAMNSHCLMQDLSYYCCIELLGAEDQLLASLSQLTSKDVGPTFAAAACLLGRKQGSTMVYKAGQYPSQALGPVTFMWRPRTQGSTHRQLWIWVHPTLKQDLLPELQNVCHCCEPILPPAAPVVATAELTANPDPETKSEMTPPKKQQAPGTKRKRSCKNDSENGPPAKKILGDGTRSPTTPVTWTSGSTGISINDLTMEMVRYRLIGPQSHSVLTETLEAATDCDSISKSQTSSLWWPEHCKDEQKMTLHRQQADVFMTLKGIYSTGEVPPGTVLGLTVDDPRLTLPKMRVKAVPDIKQAQEVNEENRRELMLRGVPEHCSQSSLWDQSVRDNVTHNMISAQELNRMKSEMLVPGSRLSPTPLQGRVPVLLVQQPGKQVGQEMSSWGAGWDLLLPKAWGMAFWVPLVYRGVRIGGLKMSLKHSQNKGASHFPHDYPDCPAGVRFQQEQETQLSDKFKRRPPAKRTNYIKHGCLAPFRCPWQQLAEEWELITREGDRGQSRIQPDMQHAMHGAEVDVTPMVPQSSFSLLRNRKSLKLLSGWCRPTTSRGQRSLRVGEVTPLDHSHVTSFHRNSLVWVRLSLLAKGKPELHALVCVPTHEDLTRLKKKEPDFSGPQEPPHRDHFKSQIKSHKKGSKKPAKSSSLSCKSENKGSELPSSASVHAQTTTTDPSLTSSVGQPSAAISATPVALSVTSSVGQPSAAISATPVALSDQTSTSSHTPAKDPESASSSDLILGLWPDPLPSVTSHCSRVTLGWVTQGDFTLSAGCGEALGLVSVPGLLHTLLNQPVEQRGLLLLRNPTSLQYRFAKINIEV